MSCGVRMNKSPMTRMEASTAEGVRTGWPPKIIKSPFCRTKDNPSVS